MNTRQLLISLPLLGFLSCALYLVASVARENRNTFACQSNLKQIGLGLMQYERDYDEKTVLKENWQTALQPYTKNNRIFGCPSGNGYAFNGHLISISMARVEDPRITPALFDSTSTQPNPADFGTSYPIEGAHSVWKHGRGTNVAFFDGHVKWMQQKPTFEAIKPLPRPRVRQKAKKTPQKRDSEGRVIVPIRTR